MKLVKISVIMPTLNEELALPGTLQALADQSVDYELIVVDGGSVDRTRDIVRNIPGARCLSASRGRASQMNHGARAAKGEWLVFLHADTVLPHDAFEEILLAGGAGADAGGFYAPILWRRLAIESRFLDQQSPLPLQRSVLWRSSHLRAPLAV